MMRRTITILALTALFSGCAGEDLVGLRATPAGPGPTVVWDLEVRPIPDIPFPNDFALSLVSDSATGRRINISRIADTEIETRFRERASRLDGFGTWAPITVRFDAALDLGAIVDRQLEDDFGEHAVLVIDVTPASPDFGRAQRLDFGRGWLPGTVMDPWFYGTLGLRGLADRPQTDPNDGTSSLVFEPDNLHPADGNPWDDLATFYEKSTDTLILRPVVPLRGATRYAVVLTSDLVGEDGSAVRSPFPFVHAAAQSRDLAVLPQILEQYGRSVESVAFAWTFTTQSVTLELERIRAGLYGHGPFARLKEDYPPNLILDPILDEPGALGVDVLTVEEFMPLTEMLSTFFGLPEPVATGIRESYENVSHLVIGRYTSPNFLVDKDGDADDDEAFEINAHTGEAVVAPAQVSFLCVIPKSVEGRRQPFPVSLKTNGTSVPKIGALGYAGFHAAHGLATCSIDAFAHGLELPPDLWPVVDSLGHSLGMSNLREVLRGTRVRDLDNDGVGDSGADFWSPDPFHSRDTIRQTVVDWLQFVRALRAFGADGRGDWDGDGTADLGGEDTIYGAWGVSLGGVVTAVLAGIEPKLSAAVPQSGGGGLTDIAARSLQPGVPEMVLMGSWGPFIMGRPDGEGGTSLEMMLPHFERVDREPFGVIQGVQPGDVVEITNDATADTASGPVSADGGFRVGIQADALLPTELRATLGFDPTDPGFEPVRAGDVLELGDPLRVCVFGPDGSERGCVDRFEKDVEWAGVIYPEGQPLVALTPGFGRDRQTPDFRRLLGIAQTMIDPADPINWARHYFLEPLDFTYDSGVVPGCNVLDLLTVGDANVPVSAGIAIARAAGIVDPAGMNLLTEHGVVEGNARLGRYRTDGSGPLAFDPQTNDLRQVPEDAILFDVDDLDDDSDGFGAPSPAAPLRATVDSGDGGVSALRILYVSPHGSHGLLPPDPSKKFDVESYGVELIGRYLVSGGTDLID